MLLLLQFATIFTPQGDGNMITLGLLFIILVIRHDIYPARGRKLIQAVSEGSRMMIRHDIYPARGRKRSVRDH